jgi:xanthine dehydrogenase YagR molybdenum-binding subunit
MSEAAPQPKENMGQPAPRIDGRLKVTGQAKYGSDFHVPRPAYAYLVTSSISRGSITGFDDSDARKVPGILLIMTHENTKVPGEFKFFGKGGEASTAKKPLDGNSVSHDGDYVAVIVADTYENAREAAHRFKVHYDAQQPTGTMDQPNTEIHDAAKVSRKPTDQSVGNAEAALAQSEVRLDAEYYTPTQHHNPIELFTTTCAWNGDEPCVYEPSQFVVGMKHGLARELNIEPHQVRVISPFVGGAFGSKGSLTPRTVLIAMAARQLNRPVKLVATRDQGFTIATYRAETRHHLKMGAGRDGKLKAYWHEGWELTSRTDDYVVGGVDATAAMYQTPNLWTKVHLVKCDRNTPGFMRSPSEVPYMFALESAMDEMAVALKMDPVEFRRVNDTAVNPVTGAPYTSRSLMKCYDEASKAFGWEKRNPQPSSMREGEWLIGWGCATATYPTQLNPCAARVRFDRQGNIRVQVAAHDVGTGAYTVIGQMAALMLNQPLEKVFVELGESELPPGPVAGGSITTSSACSAVKGACGLIQTKLFQRTGEDAMKGVTPEQLAAAFDKFGSNVIEEFHEWVPVDAKPGAAEGLYQGKVEIVGGPLKTKTMFAFGAEFVEVRVNMRTREIRVSRVVGAFAAGRIMNTRTARSQLMGGMIWGVSAALFEETEIDERNARYVNDNLADYLLPVNADIKDVTVILVPEIDDKVNPAGTKGLGEFGNVGTNAAVANAVYHATGKRFRALPIHVEDFFI